MPSWFEPEWYGEGGSFVETTEGLARTLRAEALDPLEFFAFVTGRSDRSLEEYELPPSGDFDHDVSIAPWPDDELWRDFATEGVTELLPVLEDLVGVPSGPCHLQGDQTTNRIHLLG